MVETLLSQWHWDTFPMALGHLPNGIGIPSQWRWDTFPMALGYLPNGVGIPPQWHWGTTLPSIGHRGFKQQMFLS
ncbi:MAG: hypothetical protein IKY22_07780 [Bacteroidales bacterium]|nr:hypothetical protein [Bacteroidales bacterium]